MTANAIDGNGDDDSAKHENRSDDRQPRSADANNPNINATQANVETKANKPNWVEKAVLLVLILTFGAAVYAGHEADRLADLTNTAITDAQTTTKKQWADTQTALALTKQSADAATAIANSTTKAATAAIRSASAASEANQINQTELRTEAAFLKPVDVELEKIANVQLTGDITGTRPIAWLAEIKWQNFGNTRSKDLDIKTYCLYSVHAESKPWTITHTSSDSLQIVLAGEDRPVFGPKEIDRGGICPVTGLDILLHAVGDYHSYVFGTAKYRDVVNPNTIHRTDFCYEIRLTGNPETGWHDMAGIPSLAAKIDRCTKHNCADEECTKQDRETVNSQAK